MNMNRFISAFTLNKLRPNRGLRTCSEVVTQSKDSRCC